MLHGSAFETTLSALLVAAGWEHRPSERRWRDHAHALEVKVTAGFEAWLYRGGRFWRRKQSRRRDASLAAYEVAAWVQESVASLACPPEPTPLTPDERQSVVLDQDTAVPAKLYDQ